MLTLTRLRVSSWHSRTSKTVPNFSFLTSRDYGAAINAALLKIGYFTQLLEELVRSASTAAKL